MFRLSSLTKRFTASMLLLLFLQVTVGQCLCAVAVPLEAAPTHAAHEHTAPPMHPGCHGHGSVAHHDGKTTGHHSPARQSHDCCKDKSAAVLKALTTPPTARLALNDPLLLSLPPVQGFTFSRSAAWSRALAMVLVPPQHLPPKIPDVRVFLRSLTV